MSVSRLLVNNRDDTLMKENGQVFSLANSSVPDPLHVDTITNSAGTGPVNFAEGFQSDSDSSVGTKITFSAATGQVSTDASIHAGEDIDATYMLASQGVIAPRIFVNGIPPAITLGAAAGSSPSAITKNGGFAGSNFSFTSGTGATTGVIATFAMTDGTFTGNFAAIVLTPMNAASVLVHPFVAFTSSTIFTINATVALTDATAYRWAVVVLKDDV